MVLKFKVRIVGESAIKNFDKDGWISFKRVPVVELGGRYYSVPHFDGPFIEGQEIEITEDDLGEEEDPQYYI